MVLLPVWAFWFPNLCLRAFILTLLPSLTFPFGICGTLASSASIAPQIPREVFMIYEFSSHEAMIQAWAEDPGLPGPSPGGAASMLKITRQGVYQAVKRGSLT